MSKSTKEIISDNIAKFRKEIGLSQKELAEKIGAKNLTTISSWERGVSSPDADTILKLCILFDISLNDLYNVKNIDFNHSSGNNILLMEITFGEKINAARTIKGLTQKQLADKIGAKHNSISDWEKNKNKPDPDTIKLLCEVLEISPNYLLSNSVNDEVSPTEKKLLNKYRSLDNHGKKTVDFILDNEYERSKNSVRNGEIAEKFFSSSAPELTTEDGKELKW